MPFNDYFKLNKIMNKPFLEDEINETNTAFNDAWDKCRIEMLGRLETLKYDTEGNSHQKSYNEAIRQAQDQINIPTLPIEIWDSKK